LRLDAPLRPYQQECVDAVLSGFGEFQKQLAVAPTGSGKTVIFSHLANSFAGKGRVCILAHREELIDQAIEKLHRSTGIFADKEKAAYKASLQSDVVVASVQTLCRRLGKWPQDHFELVIVDEAHHALADSYQSVLQHFAGAKILGVTATPDRGDKKNLGKYFQNIAFEISLFDLIHQGYLSRISVQSIPIEIDLKGIRSTAGDFNESDVGERLEPWLMKIAEVDKAERRFPAHADFPAALRHVAHDGRMLERSRIDSGAYRRRIA
jgi:superfamily II DNA or RNA helicase